MTRRKDAARDAARAKAELAGARDYMCPESPCYRGHPGPFSVISGFCLACERERRARDRGPVLPTDSPLMASARPAMRELGADGIEALIIVMRGEGKTVGEIADAIYGAAWLTGIPKIHAVLAKTPRRLRFRDMSADGGGADMFVSRFSNWGNKA